MAKKKETEKKPKEKKAKYISQYLNLRLVNKASYTKEVEGRVVVVPGHSIQFEEGKYESSDPEEIKFLDNHPNCGNTFIKVKDKDLDKARENNFKDLETKETEAKEKEEKKKKKGKALEEGSTPPKGKGKKGAKPEKEKPAF